MSSPKENSSDDDVGLGETQLDEASVAPVSEHSALAATAAAPSSEGGLDAEWLLPAQPNTIVKHYEVIRKLGEGGMGAVYLARDTRLGRRVGTWAYHQFAIRRQRVFPVAVQIPHVGNDWAKFTPIEADLRFSYIDR